MNIVTENDTNEGPNDGDNYDALDYKIFSNVRDAARVSTSDKTARIETARTSATVDFEETAGEAVQRNSTSNIQVLESSVNPYYDGTPM